MPEKSPNQNNGHRNRRIAVWVTGLIGCGLVGSIFTNWAAPYAHEDALGFIAAACLFTSIRLFREPREDAQWQQFLRWQLLEQEKRDWPQRTVSRVP